MRAFRRAIRSSQNGQVAQVVERSPEKAGVGGSTPSLATIFSMSYIIFFSNYFRHEGARIVGGAAISVG